MPNSFTTNTFETTYRDDYRDSDNYHRILFKGSRALQARELTQLQSIINGEMERLGNHLFKEGSPVTPGGLTLNTNYEFVKLDAGEDITGFAVGDTLTGNAIGGGSITAKLIEIVAEDGVSNPPTFYVNYVDTQNATSGGTAIRFGSGEAISNGSVSVTSQSSSTVENPHVGRGSKVSVNGGSFWVRGHFVQVNPQSIFVDKYSSTPDAVIGMKVVEDIITVDDTDALYDNWNNGIPNLTAPGADRYRIQLTLTLESDLGVNDNFFPVNRVVGGALQGEVDLSQYSVIGKEMATRTREESGDYVVEGFEALFEEGDSDAVLTLNVSPGIAYVDGYRTSIRTPTKLSINKSRTTETLENQPIAANYDNFVVISGGSTQIKGLPNIDTFEQVDLMDAIGYTGNNIGTARVRSVTKDGANYRFYIFDIDMNDNEKFSDVRSIGTSSTSFGDIELVGGVAVVNQATNNNLFFDVGNIRPASLSDVSLTVQRRFQGATSGSQLDLSSLIDPSETLVDQTQWIVSDTSTGDILTPVSIVGDVITITGNATIEVLAFVQKSTPQIRAKTKQIGHTETSLSLTSDSSGDYYLLDNADIISVTSITDAVTSTDVSSRFVLDNGQRDNFYQKGRMNLRGGFTAPSNPINITYDYYSHGTGDFFAVNSYSDSYGSIPTFRQRNGEVVELRNVLDFRPTKDASGGFSVAADVNELPQNTSIITADVTYYRPRKDILTVTQSGLEYIQGVPAIEDPALPLTPSNAMRLKEVEMAPYVDDENDVATRKVQNRRFTMRDISDIVERIDNIEEVVTLSLLEQETGSIEVQDSAGNNRFRAGFFADNFKNHDFSDIENDQYKANLELGEQVLMPRAVTKEVPMMYDSDNSTNTRRSGDFVTLDFSEQSLIDQNLCSETENINPYEVIIFDGSLTLSPSEDTWVSRTTVTTSQRVTLSTAQVGRLIGRRDVARNLLVNPAFVNQPQRGSGGVSLADRLRELNSQSGGRSGGASVTIAPFCRSRLVRFRAEGLKPNTKHFLFFDGVNISGYARQEADYVPYAERTDVEFANSRLTTHPNTSTDLVSNASGNINGTFLLPNNDSVRFRTGERVVRVLDVDVDDIVASSSSASAQYTASGRNERRVISRPVFQLPRPARRDPLAQSFNVQNENGAFLTKIDVYFSTKPGVGTADENIPVRLEVRPVESGVPSQTTIIPGSQVTVNASDVNIPADLEDIAVIRSTPTSFVFDAPIYIPGNTEYSFVLMADTIEYNVFVAKAGDFIVGSTSNRIKRQPSLGSLFMSQNSLTWTPDQERDMMFKIHRADFETSGTALIENFDVDDAFLEVDPIATTLGDSSVSINHIGHGLGVGDVITIAGIDPVADIGGILGSSINGNRTITKVDGENFQFDADSAATETTVTGGDGITSTQNILMDRALADIDLFVPVAETNATFTGDFTDGYSLSNSTPTYGVGTTGVAFTPGEIITFESPKVVAAKVIEDAEATLGLAATPRRSVEISASFSTTDTFVSPVINMARSNLIGVNNLIDNQDSDAGIASPFNNPITWVDETDPREGSHLSKHLTVPITLEKPAVGIKVLMGVNRPNGAEFDVYYRTVETGSDIDINTVAFTRADADTIIKTDEDMLIFRDYEFTIGGLQGTLPSFTSFQIKIVMRSSNSSKIPVFRDLRAIALGT